jgi:DNA-binding transcriptional LysR family regulator
MDLNWDDLRYFLALHRRGSLSAAARELGVNHATVGRRIDGLEQAIGEPLFDKMRDGWVITELGKALLGPAEKAEAGHLGFERAVRNADDTLTGNVRIASSQLLATLLVVPFVAVLRESHPQITVDVVEGAALASLPRREADLGLRMWHRGHVPGADSVRNTRLGVVRWRLFANREEAERLSLAHPIESVADCPLIGYDDHAPYLPGSDWLAERGCSPGYVMKTNSMFTVLAAITAGIGLGFVPECLGERADLVGLSEPILEQDVWLAVHPDLSENERIRTVFDRLTEYVRGEETFISPDD